MQKHYDVTALGELLIDFTENGVSEQGNALLEANPGARPVMYSRCYRNWENVPLLLVKWGKINLADC